MSPGPPAVDHLPRRFEVRQAPLGGWSTTLLFAAHVALVAAIALAATLGVRQELLSRATGPLVGVAFLGYLVFLFRSGGSRRVLLEVQGEQVVVGENRGAYPLSRAILGEWRDAGLATRKGTVLHLKNRRRTLLVAVPDWSPGAGVRWGAPAAEDVDFVAGREVFAALVGSIAATVPEPPDARYEETRVKRWELTRNRASPGYAFRSAVESTMLLWLVGTTGGLLANATAVTSFARARSGWFCKAR